MTVHRSSRTMFMCIYLLLVIHRTVHCGQITTTTIDTDIVPEEPPENLTTTVVTVENGTVTMDLSNVSVSNETVDQVGDTSDQIAVPVIYSIQNHHVWRKPQPFEMPNTTKTLSNPLLFSYSIRPDQNSAPTLQYFGTKAYYDDLLKNKTEQTSTTEEVSTTGEPEDLHDEDFVEDDAEVDRKQESSEKSEESHDDVTEDEEEDDVEELHQDSEDDFVERDTATTAVPEEEESVPPSEHGETAEEDLASNKSSLNTSFPENSGEYEKLLEETQQMHNDLLEKNKHIYKDIRYGRSDEPEEEPDASEVEERKPKKKVKKPKYRIIRIYDDEEEDASADQDQLYFHHSLEDNFKGKKYVEDDEKEADSEAGKLLERDQIKESEVDEETTETNENYERIHPKFRSTTTRRPQPTVYEDQPDRTESLCEESPKKRANRRKLPKYRSRTEDISPEEAESRGHITTIRIGNNDSSPQSTQTDETAASPNDIKTEETKHEAKKAKKPTHSKFKKGGGKEHEAKHYSKHGEKGEKSYKGSHKHVKGQKGHHDKEVHKGKYEDQGGTQKKHEHEDGHFAGHKKGEKGEKGAKFAEHGKHEKGHSTKGEHNIHKKDEYEKKHEFFDEYNEGGESEKHGGFHQEHEGHKGGSHKGGHHDSGVDHGEHGKKGKKEEAGHYHEDKGHKEAAGHEDHYDHESKYGKKSGQDDGKKWSYKKKG